MAIFFFGNWQPSVRTEAEKDRISCGEWCKRKFHSWWMPRYPWHTQRDRDTQLTLGNCRQTANQIKKRLKLTYVMFSWKISHSGPCIMCTYSFTFPVELQISCYQQRRLQTRLTFGYVLHDIISCSSASPRLLCGMALCNYCQYSHRRHISHTQPATHDLSHILAYLHISK